MTYPAHMLAAIRAEQRDRIDARYARLGDEAGMQPGMIDVSCWLMAHGLPADTACIGEALSGWDMAGCREFWTTLDPGAQSDALASAERIIFARRNPLWLDINAYLEAAE